VLTLIGTIGSAIEQLGDSSAEEKAAEAGLLIEPAGLEKICGG